MANEFEKRTRHLTFIKDCRPWSRGLLWLFSFAAGFAALAILLLIGEAIMRCVRPDLAPSNQIRNIPDPFIGWRFLPGQSVNGTTEDGQMRRVRINALGFADENHNLETAPDTVRIAFLGDSFTAATHVDFDRSFITVARQNLQRDLPERSFETLNFGQSGFGTANEYLTWKYYAAPFRPAIVVLAFFLGNDVANNLPDYPTEDFSSPKFELVNGHLQAICFRMEVGSNAQKRRQRNWLYRTFLEPSLLYQQYKLFERDIRARLKPDRTRKAALEDASRPFWERSYAPIDWQSYSPEPDPRFETAWQITEALILQLRKEVRGTGARLHVALLPGLETMEPFLFQAALARYPGIEQFKFDLDWPRQRLIKFLANNQIPSIDLTPDFKNCSSGGSLSRLYFKFDRHFSSEGHRVAGEAIVRHLEKDLQTTHQ